MNHHWPRYDYELFKTGKRPLCFDLLKCIFLVTVFNILVCLVLSEKKAKRQFLGSRNYELAVPKLLFGEVEAMGWLARSSLSTVPNLSFDSMKWLLFAPLSVQLPFFFVENKLHFVSN